MHKKLLLLVLSSYCVAPQAAEWAIDGDFNPTFKYDDNELMRENEQEDFSVRVRPTLKLIRNTELDQSRLEFGYDVKRYDKMNELDRQDPFVNLASNHQFERGEYGISMSYSDRESRSFADEDTGDFSNTSTVTTKSVSPKFSYSLSEKDTISTNYSFRDTSRKGVSDQTDTQSNTFGLSYSRQLSERLSTGVSANYVKFDSDNTLTSSTYDSYSLSLTSSYNYSELWSLTGSLGMRYLDSEVKTGTLPAVNSTSRGDTYSFAINRNDELSSLSLRFSLALSPTSTGTVNEQTFYTVSYNRDLSERLKAGVYATYREYSSPNDSGSSTGKYTDISPSLSWKLSEKLALNLNYKYRTTDTDSRNKISSNSVSASVSYNWDGLRFSR